MKHKGKMVDYHTLHFICKLAKALKPKEILSISEWADRYMVLPAGSNEAGKFKIANMPWQKEIMDAISSPEVIDVTCMTSAQIGKTTIVLCGIAYYIEHEPATQMMVLPTIDLGEKFSKTRLAAMIRDIPDLAAKITPPKSRDSNNTILFKAYPGGHIVVAGANSPASLSSMPLRVIWMDEVDRFPESAGTEGNPVLLAEKRANTFWNKKHIKTSTPTIRGKSRIESEFLDGSMEEWCVCCPSCGEFQPYEFSRVNFEEKPTMTCRSCGEMIPEKDWKESEHAWIAEHPERKTHRSFHMNELASPYIDWSEIISTFRKAVKRNKDLHDPNDLQVFINTVLGECWDESEMEAESLSPEVISDRAEHYRAEIPDGVLMLTGSVDVQDDRFEIEIRGWSRNYESWGLYKTEIYGDLIKNEVWDKLESYLDTTYHFADGVELNLAGFGIDHGGHYPNQVLKWVKRMKQKGKRAYALKGFARSEMDGIQLLHKTSNADITEEYDGKKIVVDHVRLNIIGVDSGKDDIMHRLAIEIPGEGYCHFPSNAGRGYDDVYYEGLLSEKKITKLERGKLKTKWVKKPGVRNEPLDLFNYNYAVSELIRPDWDLLEHKLEQGINYMRATKKKRKSRRKVGKGVEV